MDVYMGGFTPDLPWHEREVFQMILHIKVIAFNPELIAAYFMEMTDNARITEMLTSPEPSPPPPPPPNGLTHTRESALFRKVMNYGHVSWGGTG